MVQSQHLLVETGKPQNPNLGTWQLSQDVNWEPNTSTEHQRSILHYFISQYVYLKEAFVN